jgi:hypothetical protein
MVTAIVYLLTSITLAVIMGMSRIGSTHATCVGDFRYQPGLLKTLKVCAFIPIAAAIFIYWVAEPRPPLIGILVLNALGLAGTFGALYLHKYLKSFVVNVEEVGVVIKTQNGVKLIPFERVAKAIYLSPTGKGGTFCVYGGNGEKLVEFSDTLVGIDELVKIFELKAKRFGIVFERRSRRI